VLKRGRVNWEEGERRGEESELGGGRMSETGKGRVNWEEGE